MLAITSFLLIATVARAGAELPPKQLLHVGEKSVLLTNAAHGHIPIKDWDRFIMGEETTWRLPQHRRGLYGGKDLGDLEKYGASSLAKGAVPWLMKVTLKDDCRTTGATTGTYYDPRFTNWVIANADGILASAPQCLQAEIYPGLTADCGQMFTGSQFTGGNKPENDCDRLLTRFLDESAARVVADAANYDSWYIRDRNCIERIDADPLMLLEEAAVSSWSMKAKIVGAGAGPVFGAAFFVMLNEALGDLRSVPEELLARLEAAAVASDVRPTNAESDDNLWFKKNIPPLVQAFRRCSSNGAPENFSRAANLFRASIGEDSRKDRESFMERVEAHRSRVEAVCR
jgi:hypothetical protein